MANKLFQEARTAVQRVENLASSQIETTDLNAEIEKARNCLTSAFIHSSTAEKEQLTALQEQLHSIESRYE